MNEPDWLMLAAAERAVMDALEPTLFVDDVHIRSEATEAKLTAYRTAKRRLEVFEAKGSGISRGQEASGTRGDTSE